MPIALFGLAWINPEDIVAMPLMAVGVLLMEAGTLAEWIARSREINALIFFAFLSMFLYTLGWHTGLCLAGP